MSSNVLHIASDASFRHFEHAPAPAGTPCRTDDLHAQTAGLATVVVLAESSAGAAITDLTHYIRIEQIGVLSR